VSESGREWDELMRRTSVRTSHRSLLVFVGRGRAVNEGHVKERLKHVEMIEEEEEDILSNNNESTMKQQ
jgi:hypothetical protein